MNARIQVIEDQLERLDLAEQDRGVRSEHAPRLPQQLLTIGTF
jgi:hypothetical protein